MELASMPAAASSATTAGPMSPMISAMDRIAQHASFDRPGDSAAVLAAGHDYLQSASRTVDQLGSQLQERTERLHELEARGGDPTAAAAERQQIDLLSQLRDRIAESVQRVGDILSGRGRRSGSATTDEDELRRSLMRNRRREQSQLELEEHHQVLIASAAGAAAFGTMPPAYQQVQQRYALGS